MFLLNSKKLASSLTALVLACGLAGALGGCSTQQENASSSAESSSDQSNQTQSDTASDGPLEFTEITNPIDEEAKVPIIKNSKKIKQTPVQFEYRAKVGDLYCGILVSGVYDIKEEAIKKYYQERASKTGYPYIEDNRADSQIYGAANSTFLDTLHSYMFISCSDAIEEVKPESAVIFERVDSENVSPDKLKRASELTEEIVTEIRASISEQYDHKR